MDKSEAHASLMEAKENSSQGEGEGEGEMEIESRAGSRRHTAASLDDVGGIE